MLLSVACHAVSSLGTREVLAYRTFGPRRAEARLNMLCNTTYSRHNIKTAILSPSVQSCSEVFNVFKLNLYILYLLFGVLINAVTNVIISAMRIC